MQKKLSTLFFFLIAFSLGIFSFHVISLVSAHGGDTNLVHACIRNTLLPSAANVRIVDANVTCNANETALDWPKTVGGGGGSESPVSVGGGLSGRWEGTITMPDGACSPAGIYPVQLILVQDSDGNLTGSSRNGDPTVGGSMLYSSAALSGLVEDTTFEIEAGASSHYFNGTISDVNTISGKAYPGEPDQCQEGSFTATRVPSH